MEYNNSKTLAGLCHLPSYEYFIFYLDLHLMNIKNEFSFINLWIVNITINNILITIKYLYTLLQILLY